mmetsp:Transcript_23717/g.54186  ORF Transcript_23717/g.54186 Transcript_23717/m.54186 type:complete len:336 (+) Transcript_23717:403-1410(+)
MDTAGVHFAAPVVVLLRRGEVLVDAQAKLVHETQVEGRPSDKGRHPLAGDRHCGSLAISCQRGLVVYRLGLLYHLLCRVHGGHGVILVGVPRRLVPLLEGGRDPPAIIRVVTQPQLRGCATLLRGHLVEALGQRPAVVPHLRGGALVRAGRTRKQQGGLAGVKEVGRVHLCHLVACLRQLQEEQRRPVRLLLVVLVGIDQLAGDPLPALADLLEQVHRYVAVSHGADPVQVHDGKGVGRWRMPTIQGLRVVEDGLLEALLCPRARQVHARKVEHAVRGPTIGRLVEVAKGLAHVPGLRVCAPEIDEAEAVVAQGVVLGSGREEVGVCRVEVLRRS